MAIVRLARAGGAVLLALALGATSGLAAPPLQTTPDGPATDEPATLPLCSDLSLPPRSTASNPPGPAVGPAPERMTSEGVRQGPSAEEQPIAAQGTSAGGLADESGPAAQSGPGSVACADTPA
jgi:hypothetical protein